MNRVSLAVVGVVLLAVLTACDDRGDPDPGGGILDALKSVEAGLPAMAADVNRQYVEPTWQSCDGRPETEGWSDIAVYLEFRTVQTPEELVAYAEDHLVDAGWQNDGATSSPLGPGQRWSRTLDDGTVASASLGPNTRDGAAVSWTLTAIAPPHGRRVSGC